MVDYSKVFVCSGRVCGWDEDETKFVQAETLEQAIQRFEEWLVDQHDEDDVEEIFVNFAHQVSDYKAQAI